jgi:pimeloyl-ACP methyl ester carboxylesterase
MIANRIFVKPEQGTLRQQFIERWAANDKRAYLNTIDAIAGWSVADQLGEITCPALIIAADEDYTPVSVKRDYAARMPYAELTIIADSHHATPVERPRAFNHVLNNFLQTTDATAHPPKGA